MAKRPPGLFLRGQIWHIDKTVHSRQIRGSTGTSDLLEAEAILARRIEEIRQEVVYGKRKDRTFLEAATRYLTEHKEKKSVGRDAVTLKLLAPEVGQLPLERVHAGTLQPFIERRQKAGISAGTINRDLAIVKRILTLATRYWRDESGKTWLEREPLIPQIKGTKRKPHPMSWEEQRKLFAELPSYLGKMALFAVNTGCRDQEVCGLQWKWERKLHGASIFVLPEESTKGSRERIIVLNSVAASVIAGQRGLSQEWVFPLEGKPLSRMTNKAWLKARKRAGLGGVRVHDLRHTFARRLRAAGVSLEDREDLLGHHAGRITTHYSRVEITNLIEAVEKIVERETGPELSVIRS